MKLVIVSGRSGSGKSAALNVLEDLGYYCIDNLPAGLLTGLVKQAESGSDSKLEKMAISIDARNLAAEIQNFPVILEQLQSVEVDVLFLDAQSETLLRRFSATRRKHPLTHGDLSLKEAIRAEKKLLEPIARNADLKIDTSNLTIYQLRDLVKVRIAGRSTQDMAILFQSFGFKRGVPIDADFVFDVRCLPNPYWDIKLRPLTGLDEAVQNFLKNQDDTRLMIEHITDFLETWIPKFKASNRSYMTISIGCTGGQHRSVYVAEMLGKHFSTLLSNVQIRHKELNKENAGTGQ